VYGTGCAGDRRQASSHTDRAGFKVSEQGHSRYRSGASQDPRGSGRARESGDAVYGTGCAGDRRQASSHTDRAGFKVSEQGHSRYRNGTSQDPRGSGRAREAGDAVCGTGCAGVRG
ncbi:hypothetical protein, partial [Pseudomonas putida]